MGEVILALDPAKRRCGWALFAYGRLDSCGVNYVEGEDAEGLGIVETGIRLAPWSHLRPDVIVWEMPQIYGKGKARPMDILHFAVVGGVIAAKVAEGAKIVEVLPREWKGQRPKYVTQRLVDKDSRVDNTLLETAEVPKRYQGDMYDAIGIGLWYLDQPREENTGDAATTELFRPDYIPRLGPGMGRTGKLLPSPVEIDEDFFTRG